MAIVIDTPIFVSNPSPVRYICDDVQYNGHPIINKSDGADKSFLGVLKRFGCTGCGSCVSGTTSPYGFYPGCPTNAISLVTTSGSGDSSNPVGLTVAQIDSALCNNCGNCVRACLRSGPSQGPASVDNKMMSDVVDPIFDQNFGIGFSSGAFGPSVPQRESSINVTADGNGGYNIPNLDDKYWFLADYFETDITPGRPLESWYDPNVYCPVPLQNTGVIGIFNLPDSVSGHLSADMWQTLFILNNLQNFQLSSTSASVSAPSTVTVTVNRSGPGIEFGASVDYSTNNGNNGDTLLNAVAGVQYTATSGTLEFAPGESSSSFDVAVELLAPLAPSPLAGAPYTNFGVSISNPRISIDNITPAIDSGFGSATYTITNLLPHQISGDSYVKPSVRPSVKLVVIPDNSSVVLATEETHTPGEQIPFGNLAVGDVFKFDNTCSEPLRRISLMTKIAPVAVTPIPDSPNLSARSAFHNLRLEKKNGKTAFFPDTQLVVKMNPIAKPTAATAA